MKVRPACLAGLLCLVVTSLCPAQVCCPALTGRGPAPFLYVRFGGAPGTRVTLYQGRAPARGFASPAVVGLRPGYGYRVMLSNIPGHPGLTLFPSIQVSDSLHLPAQLNPANHPATVIIDDDDIESIRQGSMVTKLIYLEHPDHADPRATKQGETLQTTYPPGTDLYKQAQQRGRPMLLVHLGERMPTTDELVRQNVPGTILHPGEKAISPASAPPCFRPGCVPLHDPLYGPRPREEECFHDGGDRAPKAAPDGCDKVRGLDPEDTIAEYRDGVGRKQIACSNRLCICVPRFIALRSECPLNRTEAVMAVEEKDKIISQGMLARRIPSIQAFRYEQLRGYLGRLRPGENVAIKGTGQLTGLKVLQAREIDMGPAEYIGSKKLDTLEPVQRALLVKQLALAKEFSGRKHLAGTEQVTLTSVVGRVESGPHIIRAEASVRDITVCCNETPCLPDRPLVLIKCADRVEAKIGDIITFTLRYSNVGGKPITDVAVSDSLSGRLEYIEGSAEADRDAVFTSQANEAGSLILRWEISGKLLPGQSGRVKFKAKVR